MSLASFYRKRDSVLCTASVSPLDRDKDTVLDPIKMLAHFAVIFFTITSFCRTKSLGKEENARGEEPLFKGGGVCNL